MELFLETFRAVAMLLGVGVVGFWVVSRRLLPERALESLSTLALEIALPCLIFARIARQFRPEDQPQWWLLPVAWLAFTAFAAILSLGAMRLAQTEGRREFGLTLFYQNATFFPLAIITQLFGADSVLVVDLFFFVMFFGALLFGTYRLFFAGGMKWPGYKKLLHPVLVATLLAAVCSLTGISGHMPGFALDSLTMIGQMTVPLLMIILGGSIYLDFRASGTLQPWEVAKFITLKNLLFPLAALGLLLLIRPPRNLALIILLESAVPPVTSAPVLIRREDGDRALASQFLVGSFLFSLVSLPAMLALFGEFFAMP